MIEKNEFIRRLVILLWVLLSGLLLWLMSRADMEAFNEQAYFRFVTFIFSGSFAFQVLYELATSPISILTKEHWSQIRNELIYASLTILAFAGVVNFEAHVKNLYLIPSMLTFCLMVIRVIGHSQTIHRIVKEIKEIEK